MNESKLVRLSVNMNEETAEALKRIGGNRGISFTETIRRAIALTEFLDAEESAGRVILTADQNRENVRELILL